MSGLRARAKEKLTEPIKDAAAQLAHLDSSIQSGTACRVFLTRLVAFHKARYPDGNENDPLSPYQAQALKDLCYAAKDEDRSMPVIEPTKAASKDQLTTDVQESLIPESKEAITPAGGALKSDEAEIDDETTSLLHTFLNKVLEELKAAWAQSQLLANLSDIVNGAAESGFFLYILQVKYGLTDPKENEALCIFMTCLLNHFKQNQGEAELENAALFAALHAMQYCLENGQTQFSQAQTETAQFVEPVSGSFIPKLDLERPIDSGTMPDNAEDVFDEPEGEFNWAIR